MIRSKLVSWAAASVIAAIPAVGMARHTHPVTASAVAAAPVSVGHRAVVKTASLKSPTKKLKKKHRVAHSKKKGSSKAKHKHKAHKHKKKAK